MKANAPEKIYRTTTYLDNNKGKTLWRTKPVMGAENIEYIRKDALIEKARKWFEECFMNVHKWEISTYEFENIQSMIDEFRKYMEEE